ncbi:MAG TPA: ATP-binding protein [Stellaceae bacterium]|nr:ATP-binding protein [Stellaceae bacterium]
MAARYAIAGASVAVALAIGLLLQLWDDRVTVFPFFAAVVGSAWLGTGPGALAVGLSVVVVQYFFTPPGWGFEVMPQDLPFMAAFIVCAVMSLAWASQRRRTELALQEARAELEDMVQQRTAELVRTNSALKAEMAERQAAEIELRDTEEKLARTSRLATAAELATSIAHEINQPLAAIVVNAGACARLLRKQPAAIEDARAAAEAIVSDGQRAGDVITRVRSLVSKQAPVQSPVDINQLIRETVALARGACRRQKVSLRTALTADLPPVLGDAIQLQQLFLNLITNGIEAMAETVDRPRRLTIRSKAEDPGSVLVVVEDNGNGLDAACVDRLFESFYTTKPGGIGLGLAISKSIVEAHGGRLSASPATPFGAQFTVALPAGAEAQRH